MDTLTGQVPTPSSRAIAIGGSEGSIPVLKKILGGLPSDFPAPVFVVVHVGARGSGLLADVCSGSSVLPVKTAVEGMPVLPGEIYVAPDDHHLLVMEGSLRLGRGPRENFVRPAMDPLFRSVALSYGPGAIGIVLSGNLNDGTAGLNAIKRCNGLTVVQNPTDSQVSEMPMGALEATDVDYRCNGSDMAELLMRLVISPVPEIFARPSDIELEVDIALGRPCVTSTVVQIGTPSVLSCPACGGVLSEMAGLPLRYRCQVGHAFTAKCMASTQEGSLDEALRVALRIVEERANLSERMAKEANEAGRHRMCEDFNIRAKDLRANAEILRSAALGRHL